MRITTLALAVLLAACSAGDPAQPSLQVDVGEIVADSVESEEASFRIVRLVDGLEHPWGMDWLPDGRLLVTERPGRMVLVDGDSTTRLSGVPDVWDENQGGLLDVRVDPDFLESGRIWFTWSMQDGDVAGTVVSHARLEGDALVEVQEFYRQAPFLEPDYHFGSRIVFPDDGTVVVAMGERGQRRERTVDIPTPTSSVGATVRLSRDGTIPEGNPYHGSEEGLDEVWSYGHRNPQGMAIRPGTGEIWLHEHGPHGGDELNLVQPGANYGWPAVSYGDTYSTPHEAIGGTEAPGITPPVEYWDPSPALSGMSFHTGGAFPAWDGDLFVGALAMSKLMRLELDASGQVAHQEDLIQGEIGRIRDVATGPDGYLYLLTDAENGGLYRLEPTDR